MLHSTVEGFMGGLKALPKGSAERGKFITSHMSHGPFLSALKAHPQGAKLHGTLTNYLNSPQNAGLRPGASVFKSASVNAFFDELTKIAEGRLAPGLSMGGLAGLTAIEGAGAFDKEKSPKERAKDAASAGFTGSILASEALHNKKMLKNLLTKKAALRPTGQAAMAKMVSQHGLRPDVAAHYGMTARPAAAAATPAPTLRRATETSHDPYSSFMPAGRFTQAGGGLPAQTQQGMRQRSQAMAKQVAQVAPRPSVFKGV